MQKAKHYRTNLGPMGLKPIPPNLQPLPSFS